MSGNVRWMMAGAVLAALAGCNAKTETKAVASTGPKPVTVTVAPLKRMPVERTVEVVGTLKGWEEVTIGSKRMGRVEKVHHDMGDRVKAGEPLVALDAVDAVLAVEQAEKRLLAELAKLGLSDLPPKDFDVAKVPSVVQAQVALERARRDLARQRSLTNRGAGTAQELQNAENDELAAEAALDTATVAARSTLASALATKVALDVAKQARIDMVVNVPVPSSPPPGEKRPVTYALSKRQVSEGQMVREGDPIAMLVIEDPLRLWAEVPERFAPEVALKQAVRLTVSSRPGETFEGVVARINPAVDPISRTFQVEAVVPNPEGLLRPGGFAKASIVTRRDAEAVVVPTESVVRFAGVTKLFVVEADKAKAIPVTTELEGRGWIEVQGDLPKEGQVVTSGQTQLADGTAVVVREPKAEK